MYSCFPAAVRVQQREFGLDPDGTPTVTGGMSFAGGPFNNFVLNATAAVVAPPPGPAGGTRAGHHGVGHALQTGAGRLVRLTSGPALARWPTWPDRPRSIRPAGRWRRPKPRGPAEVASFTVTYDEDDPLRPVRTAIVADLPDGTRTAATCDDAAIALSALSESLIGQTVHIAGTTFSL